PPVSARAARSARARCCCVPFGSSRASLLSRTAALIVAVVAAPRTGVVGIDRLGAGLLGLAAAVLGLAAAVLGFGAGLLGPDSLSAGLLGLAGPLGLAGLLGLDTVFEREPRLDEEASGCPEGTARHLARTERGLSPGHVGRPRSSGTP